MDINAKKQRMKELIEILDKAAKAYYAFQRKLIRSQGFLLPKLRKWLNWNLF